MTEPRTGPGAEPVATAEEDGLVRVVDLVVAPAGGPPVVDGVSLTVRRGEVLGVVGRSGAGKTTLVLSLLGHTRPGLYRRGGTVRVAGLDPERDAHRLRGRVVSYLGQDPAASLNPGRKLGSQLQEAVRRRSPAGGAPAPGGPGVRVAELLAAVRLPADRAFLRRYPHQISGGQAQRVAFAMAMAGAPELLVLDEPTAGLDTVLARELRELIRDQAAGCAVVLVSHDQHLIGTLAHRVLVLDADRARTAAPRPGRGTAAGGEPSGQPVLRAQQLGASHGCSQALAGVDLAVHAGECLAVVGPSGSGKSTLARCLVGLHRYQEGTLYLGEGQLPAGIRGRSQQQRRAVQLVAQDSVAALNPRETVHRSLHRAMRAAGRQPDRDAVTDLLARVHLPAEFAGRYPRSLSGGERQRVNLARALACRPQLLVCDEVTSALDTGTAAAVLDLLEELRRTLGLAVVLITHDLATVARQAGRLAVLDSGRVVETGPTGQLLGDPAHPVTRTLVDCSPELAPEPLPATER